MSCLACLYQYKALAIKYKRHYIFSYSAKASAYMPIFLWPLWLYMIYSIYNQAFLPVVLSQYFYYLDILYRQFYKLSACAFYCSILFEYQPMLAIWLWAFSVSILYWQLVVVLQRYFYPFFSRLNFLNGLICQISLEIGFYLL